MILGYLVIERSDLYEQPLGINQRKGMPPGGVLEWTEKARAVFPDRKSARAAIFRTENYRRAFGRTDMPEMKSCKVILLTPIKQP